MRLANLEDLRTKIDRARTLSLVLPCHLFVPFILSASVYQPNLAAASTNPPNHQLLWAIVAVWSGNNLCPDLTEVCHRLSIPLSTLYHQPAHPAARTARRFCFSAPRSHIAISMARRSRRGSKSRRRLWRVGRDAAPCRARRPTHWSAVHAQAEEIASGWAFARGWWLQLLRLRDSQSRLGEQFKSLSHSFIQRSRCRFYPRALKVIPPDSKLL